MELKRAPQSGLNASPLSQNAYSQGFWATIWKKYLVATVCLTGVVACKSITLVRCDRLFAWLLQVFSPDSSTEDPS